MKTCPNCRGSGTADNVGPCPACHGVGTFPETASEEILNDPDFKAWATHVRSHVMPMMQDSALVVSLVPKGDSDIKFAVELGMAIMLDKPIVAVVEEGTVVTGKLRMVADSILQWDHTRPPKELSEALQAEMRRLGINEDDDGQA